MADHHISKHSRADADDAANHHMLTKLLRLIPAFRALERNATALAERNTRLQDDVRRLQAAFDAQSAELMEALRDGRHAREVVADWVSMQLTGCPIYGAAPALPEHDSAPTVVPARKMHGRDLVRQAEAQFMAEYERLVEKPQ